MRVIDITLSEEQTADVERKDAIYYLMFWNYTGFDNVRISSDGRKDMIAYYDNNNDNRKYVIGAIKRGEGEYSFHS